MSNKQSDQTFFGTVGISAFIAAIMCIPFWALGFGFEAYLFIWVLVIISSFIFK